MQVKLLHAVLSGIVMAAVLGLMLIPSTWKVLGEEPVYGSPTDGLALIGIVASIAIMLITMLSFKFVERTSV